jgi:hypothetical protein
MITPHTTHEGLSQATFGVARTSDVCPRMIAFVKIYRPRHAAVKLASPECNRRVRAIVTPKADG